MCQVATLQVCFGRSSNPPRLAKSFRAILSPDNSWGHYYMKRSYGTAAAVAQPTEAYYTTGVLVPYFAHKIFLPQRAGSPTTAAEKLSQQLHRWNPIPTALPVFFVGFWTELARMWIHFFFCRSQRFVARGASNSSV